MTTGSSWRLRAPCWNGEGLRVVGVAATSAEALRRARELRPQVVLVDISLGVRAGSTWPGGWPDTAGAAARP